MFKNLFSRKLTPKRFADRFMQRMAKEKIGSEHHYDEKEFRIVYRNPKGEEQIANLGNAYADACKLPASQCDHVIDGYIRSLRSTKLAESAEEARSRLMPVVRDASYFGIVGLMARIDFPDGLGPDPAAAPLAKGLAVGIVLDSEHATAMVTQKHLADWGWSFEEALKIATDNLRSHTEMKFRAAGDGLFISSWLDVYDASRMLLTDMLFRLPLRGDPVVAVPSRNHLLVCGAKDMAALELMVSMVADILENETRPSSAELFALDGNSWKPFRAEVPSASKLEAAQYSRRLHDYEQQKGLLEKRFKREGRDVFVASYKLFKKDDTGKHHSLTQWTKGVLTLLPIVDQLVLLDMGTREMSSVNWEKAAVVLGERLCPVDDYVPLRVQVDCFPSTDQLAALRAAASTVQTV
jgi:hypothetical protein